jgi:hypothetical protein
MKSRPEETFVLFDAEKQFRQQDGQNLLKNSINSITIVNYSCKHINVLYVTLHFKLGTVNYKVVKL